MEKLYLIYIGSAGGSEEGSISSSMSEAKVAANVNGLGRGGCVTFFRSSSCLMLRQQYLLFSHSTSRISVTLQTFLQRPCM